MSEELTKDDLYEIEKALDIYAGFINDSINKYCQTSIHWDAVKDKSLDSPLNDAILSLEKASKRIKEIRDKLQVSREK